MNIWTAVILLLAISMQYGKDIKAAVKFDFEKCAELECTEISMADVLYYPMII